MMDSSAVYQLDMLDEASKKPFDPSKPWLFETKDELICCATEDEACALQRVYREIMGFDPITGERT